MLVTLLCLVSCNEKKQPTEYKEPVDVTLRDADGVPMGFHKGYDGVTYYDNDILHLEKVKQRKSMKGELSHIEAAIIINMMKGMKLVMKKAMKKVEIVDSHIKRELYRHNCLMVDCHI